VAPVRGRSRQLLAFRAGTRLAALLPGVVGRTVAEAGGVLAARAPVPAGIGAGRGLAERRALVRRHLRRVLGPGPSERELSRRVDDTFASYARYWAESLRLPSLTRSEIDAGMSFRRLDRLFDARAAGRGVILALPHLGGWEWGGTWIAGAGHPTSVVVEALADPDLFEWFVGWRRHLGLEVIPAGPSAGAAYLAALRANRVLCLLCDRVVGGVGGVAVEFFGERTLLPAGPVTLALRTGAPLLPAAVYFGPGVDEHLAVVRPPVDLTRHGRLRDDIVAGTQALAAELEELIGRAPTQWHLMQPNWPSDTGGTGGPPGGPG
jgi:lauroyl/myristoyl acyltransferase